MISGERKSSNFSYVENKSMCSLKIQYCFPLHCSQILTKVRETGKKTTIINQY